MLEIGTEIKYKDDTNTFGVVVASRPTTFNGIELTQADVGCVVDTTGYANKSSQLGENIRWCRYSLIEVA